MIAAFLLQLRQILGGKRKWLVVAIGLLPLLLILMGLTAGGLKRGQEPSRQNVHRSVPKGMGDPIEVETIQERWDVVPGWLAIEKGKVLFRKRRGRPKYLRIGAEKHPFLVYQQSKLWVDESRRPEGLPRHWSYEVKFGARRKPFTWTILATVFLFLLYPQAVSLLLTLFYGSSLLGNELDNKTLTYLFTRPTPRWRVVLGQYLAIVVTLVPPVLISLSIGWLMMGMPGETRLLGALLVASLAAVLAYNAVFVLIGFLIPGRAIVIGLIYAVVFEFLLSLIPALINSASVTYYTRSLVVELAGLEVPKELERVVGGASLGTAVSALCIMVVGGLAISSWLANRREYLLSDSE